MNMIQLRSTLLSAGRLSVMSVTCVAALTIHDLAEDATAGTLVVVPPWLENVEGNDSYASGSSPPSSGVRWQEVHPASEFSAVPEGHNTIVSMRMRPDQSVTWPNVVTADLYELRLSTTAAFGSTLSSTFANNRGDDELVVYRGPIRWETDGASGPPQGPRAFDYIVEFTEPFTYDPSEGNLLIEEIFFAGAQGSIRGDAQLFTETRVVVAVSDSASWAPYRLSDPAVRQFEFLSRELIWDEAGPGNWSDPRWTGNGPPESPNETSLTLIRTDTVTVAADRAARALTVESGGIDILAGASLAVGETVEIAEGALLSVAGTLATPTLSVSGTSVVFPGATISVTDGLTLDTSLDMTGATLMTDPSVTSVCVESGGSLTIGHPLTARELSVAGTVQIAGADLAILNVEDGGVLSASAAVTAGDLNVFGGTLNASGDVTAETASVTDGAVQLSNGSNLIAATVRLSGGMVNTGPGNVVISERLEIGELATFTVTGAPIRVSGPNLADLAEPANFILTGGTLAIGGGSATPTGPIAVWKFEEQDLSTAGDSSTAGNDHPGTLNGATWAADDSEHLTVLRFDEDDPDGDYVEIANTGDIELGNPFTVAMWIKTSQKGVSVLGKGHGDHNWRPSEKALFIDPAGGQLKFTGRMSGEMHGTTNVADDRWHHVVVTYNGSLAEGSQEIYVDGVNDTTSRAYWGGLDDGQVFRLGWSETRIGLDYPEYVGLMDDVYLYDRSLIAAEVADLYEAFTSVVDPLPNTNLRVTADSSLYLDTASKEAVLGNLALEPGVTFEVAGAAVGFHDVTAGEGSSIQGDLSITGTLSPGDSPGTFSVIGDLTMEDGSIYEWELGTSAADLVAVRGELKFSDGWTLQLTDAGGSCTGSDQIDLFTYTGSLTWGNYAIDPRQVAASGRWDWSGARVDYDEDSVYLIGLTVVPEPGNLILSATGAVALLAFAWRRRRRPCSAG